MGESAETGVGEREDQEGDSVGVCEKVSWKRQRIEPNSGKKDNLLSQV